MTATLLKNCRFYAADNSLKSADILMNEYEILEVKKHIAPKSHAVINVENNLVVPAFIDLQVNGGGTSFFNNATTPESIMEISKAHENLGTAYILPTLISSPIEKIIVAISAVKKAMLVHPGILGMHLEGPFLNKEKHGGHNPQIIRQPSDEELALIIQHGKGVIKMITIAPEIFTSEQIQQLTAAGFVVSVGHSNATYEQAKAFFINGVSCATHLYNAMSPFTGKEPGLVGAVFSSDAYAGIIVDGVHAHFQSVKMASDLLKEKLFLVSDASFTGAPAQEKIYFEGVEISFSNGQYYTPSGKLAGSCISMLDAVKNCVEHAGISPFLAIKMATEIPAEILGVNNKMGKIEEGFSSKLLVLNEKWELLQSVNSRQHQFSL